MVEIKEHKPVERGYEPISPLEARELAHDIPRWSLKEKEIEREFHFKDFRQAIAFVNELADVAEEEDHHPDIFISYRKVRLILTTHKIGGLSRKDFGLAFKIDRLAEEL